MIEFFGLIVFRALSGAQNGAGYAKHFLLLFVLTMVLFVSAIMLVLYYPIYHMVVVDTWELIIAMLCITVSIIGIFSTGESLLPNSIGLLKDTHLWESIIIPPIMLALWVVGANVWFIILSVYPGLVLHKMFVNWGSGLPLLSDRTDDLTGKTYGIPTLGIKVPRLSMRWRIPIAIICIIIFICLNYFFI